MEFRGFGVAAFLVCSQNKEFAAVGDGAFLISSS